MIFNSLPLIIQAESTLINLYLHALKPSFIFSTEYKNNSNKKWDTFPFINVKIKYIFWIKNIGGRVHIYQHFYFISNPRVFTWIVITSTKKWMIKIIPVCFQRKPPAKKGVSKIFTEGACVVTEHMEFTDP